MPSLVVVMSKIIRKQIYNLTQNTINLKCGCIVSLKVLSYMKKIKCPANKFLFNCIQSSKMALKLSMTVL